MKVKLTPEQHAEIERLALKYVESAIQAEESLRRYLDALGQKKPLKEQREEETEGDDDAV